MKRTKNEKTHNSMTRTKYPTHTADGRKLGKPFKDMVPEHMRNVIPESNYIANGRKQRTKEEKQKGMAHCMTRKLAPAGGIPIPMAMQEDDDIKGPNESNFRLKGLNQARFNALIGALRRGATVSMACQLAGIQQCTYNEWIRKGQEGRFPYTFVAQSIKEAIAELQTVLVDRIIAAGLQHETYEEVTRERVVDPETHESKLVVTKTVTKLIPRKWQANAWYMERANPDFRLNRQPEVAETGNTPEEDLYIMHALSTGQVTKVPKEDNDAG